VEKSWARTYDLLHTFFVFDSSGKKAIAVAIEQSRLIVARDGNTFRGTWTQDNYDFSGNVLPGAHFEGAIIGTRIAPGSRSRSRYRYRSDLRTWEFGVSMGRELKEEIGNNSGKVGNLPSAFHSFTVARQRCYLPVQQVWTQPG
jgi:hypothetical protein